MNNHNLANRIDQLSNDDNFQKLVGVIISGGFKAAAVALRIIDILKNSNDTEDYQELYVCCQNLTKNASFLGNSFQNYSNSSRSAIYKNPDVSNNMTRLSENLGYLSKVNWSRYLKQSQSNIKLHSSLKKLKDVTVGWVKVSNILFNQIKDR